jgi:hypothetical protein
VSSGDSPRAPISPLNRIEFTGVKGGSLTFASLSVSFPFPDLTPSGGSSVSLHPLSLLLHRVIKSWWRPTRCIPRIVFRGQSWGAAQVCFHRMISSLIPVGLCPSLRCRTYIAHPWHEFDCSEHRHRPVSHRREIISSLHTYLSLLRWRIQKRLRRRASLNS